MKQNNKPSMSFPTKTRQQMAFEYKISTRTLSRWLKKLDIDLPSGNITPKYQKIIYEKLGNPYQNL